MAHRDRGVKLERYRHFGVPEYWIVDLDARAADVHRLSEDYVIRTVRGGDSGGPPRAAAATLQIAVADILP